MGKKVVFGMIQIPLERVALVAPVLEDAIIKDTPVLRNSNQKPETGGVFGQDELPVLEAGNVNIPPILEGVVAEVEPTSVAIVIVVLTSLVVVDVKVTSFLVNSKRLQLLQLLWILGRPLVSIVILLTALEERLLVAHIVPNVSKSQLGLLPWQLQIL